MSVYAQDHEPRGGNILLTGAAGFIGFHLAKTLLEQGHEIVGLDNLNDYYDVTLKEARLERLTKFKNFRFIRASLEDRSVMENLFAKERFGIVVNLAAQAGVRYSLKNPRAYVESNVAGFLNVLEGCRHTNVSHLVFASSSSVYGANAKSPFSEHDSADHPVSLYAATKKSNEMMAHTYANLFGLPVTGLRFFTVYGPWGRPDMAYFSFAKSILEGKAIDVYNHGLMRRDFTYIDDIVEGIVRVMRLTPRRNPEWNADMADPATSYAPYRIYNIGNNKPVELGRFIEILEELLNKRAIKNMAPMQPGDVPSTCANTADLTRDTGFEPSTDIETGLKRFVEWYLGYYKVQLETAGRL